MLEEVSDAQVANVIKLLKAKKKDPREYIPVFEQLSQIQPPARRRDEVAAALQKIRVGLPQSALNSWIHAVKVWGTEKNVPSLLTIADASSNILPNRAAAVEAIGRLPPTREGAELLVRLVSDRSLNGNALEALANMGKVVEGPVAALLKDSQTEHRIIGAVFLANVGTAKSVSVMEDYLRSETDPKCRAVGEVVLKQLRQRAATQQEKKASADG